VANKQLDEALPLLTKAASSPDYRDPGGLYNLGFAQLSKQNYPEAIDAFQRAAEALPTWAAPHAGLGWAYFGSIKPGCPCGPEDEELVQKVTEHYQKAVEMGMNDPGLKERVEALGKGEKVK
jgi:tetratricopeptide (TPR) repeat protein